MSVKVEEIKLDFPHVDDNQWLTIEAGGVKVQQYPSPLEVKMLIQNALTQNEARVRGEVLNIITPGAESEISTGNCIHGSIEGLCGKCAQGKLLKIEQYFTPKQPL